MLSIILPRLPLFQTLNYRTYSEFRNFEAGIIFYVLELKFNFLEYPSFTEEANNK